MIEVDVIRRIVFGCETAPLDVGPWTEDPEYVNLRSAYEGPNKALDDWNGVDVSFTPDQAEAVGKALIACAAEVAASIKLKNKDAE